MSLTAPRQIEMLAIAMRKHNTARIFSTPKSKCMQQLLFIGHFVVDFAVCSLQFACSECLLLFLQTEEARVDHQGV
jgi:hypothetical protein